MSLSRHERQEKAGVEALHHLWVVGERGAVSTWFSDVRSIIGHSVCNGVGCHVPRPLDGFDHHGPCEFLETDCWLQMGTLLWLDPIIAAYDRGDLESVWGWLEAYYENLAEQVAFAELAERSGL